MKKVIRLTESDLTRLVKRIIREQYNDEEEFNTTMYSNKIENISNPSDDELKRRFDLYRNKMDRFLDELKSSGTGVDGKRFLKQIQQQSDQIFWDIDEKSDVNVNGFGELQDELFRYFRSKLK